jgi:SAM-dependent methyltransferase
MIGVETKPKEFVLTEELFAETVRGNLSLTAQILSRSLEKKDLSLADRMFTEIRRKLYHWPKWKIKWRYGPNRVSQVSKEAFYNLRCFGSMIGKAYMDLGCGSHHPYGTCAVMFLNGAARTIAFDAGETDEQRAAEALYDLLADCAADPDSWRFSSISRQDFLNNIYRFNIPALKEGDLKTGIAGLPIEHVVDDIYTSSIRSNSIDFMSSRAVLEHFLDFPKALSEIKRMMSPGAIAFHSIDLADHRYYANPDKYHYWSFLAEDDDWSDGVCNRLRYSEIRECMEQAGFEILHFEGNKNYVPVPAGFHKHLKGRFKEMSDEDIRFYATRCIITKPVRDLTMGQNQL